MNNFSPRDLRHFPILQMWAKSDSVGIMENQMMNIGDILKFKPPRWFIRILQCRKLLTNRFYKPKADTHFPRYPLCFIKLGLKGENQMQGKTSSWQQAQGSWIIHFFAVQITMVVRIARILQKSWNQQREGFWTVSSTPSQGAIGNWQRLGKGQVSLSV